MKKIIFFFLIIFCFGAEINAQSDSVLSKKFWSVGVGTFHTADIMGILYSPYAGYNFKKQEVLAGMIFDEALFSGNPGFIKSVLTGGFLSYRYFLTPRFRVFEPFVSNDLFYYQLQYGVDVQFMFPNPIVFRERWINTHIEDFLSLGANLNFTSYWHATIGLGYGFSQRQFRQTSNGLVTYQAKQSGFVNQIKIGIEYNFLDIYRKPSRDK